MTWFWIGVAVGVLLTVPLIFIISRRTAQRVQRLELRARAAERLAELGTLTGGLAHEIKNPLSTIGLNLQLLRETMEDAKIPDPVSGRLTSRVAALISETDRLRAILEDFLAFAGRMRLDAHPTDVNELLLELVDFYHAQADASGVQLRTQLDKNAGLLPLDPTLIKQALLNLLLNATQAMVEARYSGAAHGGASDLILRTEAVADGVEVHVIDTGPGIPAEQQEKIFRPYFSTKKGGTGLGLPTTRRIINEHAGHLSIHSEPGRGTDFTIQLPRVLPERE
jgi:signal transduction histidine kinase